MSLADKKKALEELSALDLSKHPSDQIHSLIGKLGKYGVIAHTFVPGQSIIRARPNKPGEVFSKVSDLSYKPAKHNTLYQRASTPEKTVFYGAILPPTIREGDLDNSRVTGTLEVCKLITDKSITEGEERITFGRWNITKPFQVVSIVHNSDYYEGNAYLKQMAEDYQKFISAYPSEIVEESVMISEYFSEQFAKERIIKDYEYMLSAIYAERIIHGKLAGDNTIGGILYPSVRTLGKGFNLAINPAYVDNCMQLVAVAECTAYKKGDKIISDNDKQAIVRAGQVDFKLESIVDPKVHLGRDRVYKELNNNE